MRDDLIVNGLANSSAVLFTALQTNEILKIISLVLTCISVAVSIIYNIVKWYKDAKKDGKITIDEVKSGIEQVAKDIEQAKEEIDKSKKGE